MTTKRLFVILGVSFYLVLHYSGHRSGYPLTFGSFIMVVGGFGGSYNSLSFNLWDLDLEGGLKSGNGCLIKGGSIFFCVSCFLLLLGAIDQFLMVKRGGHRSIGTGSVVHKLDSFSLTQCPNSLICWQ